MMEQSVYDTHARVTIARLIALTLEERGWLPCGADRWLETPSESFDGATPLQVALRDDGMATLYSYLVGLAVAHAYRLYHGGEKE